MPFYIPHPDALYHSVPAAFSRDTVCGEDVNREICAALDNWLINRSRIMMFWCETTPEVQDIVREVLSSEVH